MKNASNLGGRIYFSKVDIPAVTALPDDMEIYPEESQPIEIGLSDVLYQRLLAEWTDITTPPKTRNKCVKMCRVGPVKTCCGWKLETQWLHSRATLKVVMKDSSDIGTAVETCVVGAAIAAAVAAIISGGSAAATVAEQLFFACLTAKLGDSVVSVNIELTTAWGEWS